MKKVIQISLFLLINIVLTGQTPIPKKCYLHLTGTLNEIIPVTMDLIKVYDSIYGYFLMNVGEEHPVYQQGHISQNGTFQLGGGYSEVKPQISGQMTTGKPFQATWSGKAGESFLMLLHEKNLSGSVLMNVYYLKGKKNLTAAPNSPSCAIELVILLPEESGDPIRSDSLRIIMLDTFDENQMHESDPDLMLSRIRDKFYTEYLTSNEMLVKSFPDAGLLNWFMLKGIQIINNREHVLSYCIFSYAFTGGAHGLESREFHNFNLRTGKIIRLSDFLKPGYEKDLTVILTRKLHQNLKLQPNQKLSESGFFQDDIKPNQNFYVTPEGIGFYYNHYDISPYSNGPTDLFLKYSELKSLMK